MKPEGIMLSEVSNKSINIVWFHVYEVPTVVKFIKTKIKMVVSRSWWRGEWQLVFNVYRVSVGEDGIVPEMVIKVAQLCESTLSHKLYTKNG